MRKGQKLTEDQFGTLQDNGFVSKTIKQIQIGTRGALEWIGEGFYSMEDPAKDPFSYSVIAKTKIICFSLHQKDLKYLPQSMRDQFKKNAAARAKFIEDCWQS